MMESQFQDDQLITRYLLGELSEEEQTQLEERAFADKEYSLHVRAVEKDLIDEYARGELTGASRQAFERRFFASEQRRRQIEFAKALAQLAATPLSAETKTTSWWQALFLPRQDQRLALRLALVAITLVAIVGGVWLLRESRRGRLEQAQTRPPTQGNAPPLPTATPNGTQSIEGPTPTVPTVNATPPAPPQQPVIASLLLLPGTSRSPDNLPQLTIQPATAEAQLRIAINTGEPYTQFRADLRTTAGKVIASQKNLKAQTYREQRIIVWHLPTTLLVTGEYELSLSGLTQQNQAEPIGYYYFKALKK